jgi:hypothetical protein
MKAPRGSRGIGLAVLFLYPRRELGGGWETPRPDHFTPGKETHYPLYRRLGGYHGRSRWVRKISPTPGFEPWIAQPVASRYTDYAIPVHVVI